MKEALDNFRYDRPKTFFALSGITLSIVAFTIFMSLPPSPLFRAIGVTDAQNKATALYYALFWQFRAATTDEGTAEKQQTIYGNMKGLDHTGELIVSVPSGDRFVLQKLYLADIKITDAYGTAALIGQLTTVDAKFDIYSNNQTVVWIKDVPFNVKVIESGFAVPDPNPPTNIVDIAFSTYYWRLFNGS